MRFYGYAIYGYAIYGYAIYGYAIYGYAIYGHTVYGHTVLRFYRITQQPYKLIIDTLSAYLAIGLRYDSE